MFGPHPRGGFVWFTLETKTLHFQRADVRANKWHSGACATLKKVHNDDEIDVVCVEIT
jgi:hypothetical protein